MDATADVDLVLGFLDAHTYKKRLKIKQDGISKGQGAAEIFVAVLIR